MFTSFGRMKYNQSLGAGSSEGLEKRMRSHANLAENAAMVLIVLGLLEMSGVSRTAIIILAGWFVVARIIHPMGIAGKPGPNLLRLFGSMSTYTIGIISGLWLVLVAVERLSA